MKGVKAKIHMETEETPKFFKAMLAKLEKELDQLQSLGVIKPVQFSEWATPVVPVNKDEYDYVETTKSR